MTWMLTTFGTGIPRYTREVRVNVDPAIFVELEARELSRQLDDGQVTAKLTDSQRTWMKTIRVIEEISSVVC